MQARVNAESRKRRNRWLFVGGAILVLAIGGGFAVATTDALSIRQHTGSEFSTYVARHHLGTVSIQTDESGMESDFCVLNLTKPIPDKQLANEAFQLMTQYHNLDGGDTLTIEYQPRGQTNEIEASVYYNEATQTVSMQLHEADGLHIVNRHVHWAPDTYGD